MTTGLRYLLPAVALAALGANAAGARDSPTSRADDWRRPNQCGVNCAYVFMRLMGREASYEEMTARLNPEDRGTSMADVQAFLSERGIDTEARRIDPRTLRALPLPAFALLETSRRIGHFVLIVSMSDDGVVVVDGTTGALSTMPDIEFFRSWNGHVLVRAPASRGRTYGYAGLVVAGVGLIVYAGFGRGVRPRKRREDTLRAAP